MVDKDPLLHCFVVATPVPNLVSLIAGADIHRQQNARAADKLIWRQQHLGQTTIPGHVRQRHKSDQRKELSSRFKCRTSDTQPQRNRVE